MTANLIAVASGKGGVGKTFLAVSLAHGFAHRRQRTLLVDGDLGLANIDVQLGLQPKGDLLSVMSGGLTIDQAVAGYAGGSQAPGGFDILAGRSGSGALRALPPHEVAALGQSLKLVAARYDRTVIDLGAGLDNAMLDLAVTCGRVMIVLTDEPTSLTDAYALTKVLSQRDAFPAMAVVVNMASSESQARRTYAALERACLKFLGFAPQLAGFVRRDARVPDAIRAQSSYLTRYPTGTAAQDLSRLAEGIDQAFGLTASTSMASRI